MLLDDAIALAQDMTITEAKHCYYDRTVELAEKYKALITGENGGLLLHKFRREDDDDYEQRLRLTISITPSVCASLAKPFNKALRNNKVKKSFDFGNKTRNEIVKTMQSSFYGRKRSQNKGLDYWIKMRYSKLSFSDPNAWIVTEWDAPGSLSEVIKPRPFEVPSINAWNFSIDDDDVEWLWVHQDITYRKLKQDRGQKLKDAKEVNEYTDEPGNKFTLYDEDYTITLTQVDKNYIDRNYTMQANEVLWFDDPHKAWYLMNTFKPNLGFVPAWRVGYEPDEESNGFIFVNGWHIAMPYLMKTIKSVSEMDLTMSLHAFPQKMQYVQPCPGTDKKRCDNGRISDGGLCTKCNGLGFNIHTSAQDALLYPMPGDKTDFFDLDKMLVYKTPPVELLTFQKVWIEHLVQSCNEVMFSQMQHQKVSGTPGGVGTLQTATEVNNNMQGVYDALLPFTEKVSDVWISEIGTFGRLAGSPDDDSATIICIFPGDLKMKSVDELLIDLKSAHDAGAPAFLVDQINKDIAEILYQGDDVAERMYKTKHRFYPFNGMNADEVALAVASQYVSEKTKVLYSNFEAIFTDLDLEDPGFWFLDYETQQERVDEMIQEYIDELATTNALNLQIPPGDGGGTPLPPANEGLNPGDPGYIEPQP